MRLSMDSRREVIIKAASEYRRSPKKDKSRVLDTITDVAGYNRDYASHLLSLFEKRVYLEGRNGVRYILEPDRSNKQIKRNRERRYDNDVAGIVATLWKMMDYICGKRLAAAIPWLVPKLEASGDLSLSDERHGKLISVSAATIDRILSDRKRKRRIRIYPRRDGRSLGMDRSESCQEQGKDLDS
ncbi:MAG: hypothetical protein STSR0007_11300 [Thermovirga sp.]